MWFQFLTFLRWLPLEEFLVVQVSLWLSMYDIYSARDSIEKNNIYIYIYQGPVTFTDVMSDY